MNQFQADRFKGSKCFDLLTPKDISPLNEMHIRTMYFYKNTLSPIVIFMNFISQILSTSSSDNYFQSSDSTVFDGGISNLWSVTSQASKNPGMKKFSLFTFNKKQLMKINPLAKQDSLSKDYLFISQSLKQEVLFITKLRHPSLIQVFRI